MTNTLKILFLGDIVGRPGREAITKHLPALRTAANIHFVVANGENLTGGRGVTSKEAQEMYAAGVDVLTLGNHTWDQKETDTLLQSDHRLLRPANYPSGTPGEGFRIYTLPTGEKIGVANLMGRVFMENGLDCPFQKARQIMRENYLGHDYNALIIDMHAETSSEKQCMGYIFDGKATLVAGSHTHTPTADHRIHPKGTGYITDAGMCGDYNTSIGNTFETSLPRFERRGKNPALQVGSGEGTMCGVLISADSATGLCTRIEPVRIGGVLGQTSFPALI